MNDCLWNRGNLQARLFSQLDAERCALERWRIVHRIDNLKIHLYEIPNLLVTGDGKSFPGVSEGAIIIVTLSR